MKSESAVNPVSLLFILLVVCRVLYSNGCM